MDTAAWLREGLNITTTEEADDKHDEYSNENPHGDRPSPNAAGIISVKPTAIEARYLCLKWVDGRIGRIKLSNNGRVERAIVIGDGGRDKVTENILTGGDGKVEGILERLLKEGSPG